MKFLNWLFIFIIFLPPVISADETVRNPQTELGNLEIKLNAASEEDKIYLLNELAESYRDVSPRKSIEYAKQALNIAQETMNEKEKAVALSHLGIAHKNLSDYDKSLEYHMNALKIREKTEDKKDIAESLHNIGVVYDYLNNFTKALEYYQKALKIREDIGDKKGIAASLHTIGIIHHLSSRYTHALEYYQKALKIREDIGDKKGIASSLNNIGFLYKDILNYSEALEYYLNSLKIFNAIGDKYETANISNNIGGLYLILKKYDPAIFYLEQGLNLAKEIEAKELIRENYAIYSDLYAAKRDYQKSLEYYKLSSKVKESIFTGETNARIADMQTEYETEKNQKEIELLKKDNAIKELELNQQKLLRNSFLGGFAGVLILAIVMYNMYRLKKRAHSELKEAHTIIRAEKEKSDKLLLNILPVRVANDLKEKGSTIPESFENVTVYFSDIVGFTNLSTKLEPEFLIDELNEIFTAFDNIIEKNQCERIKTIGDAYLCVCGMPEKNPNHAVNIVKSAIEIIQYLSERNQHTNIEWKIRIGIHTGKVVGGVVGVKKYIYDVFGDTINTASRMESNSEPMRINISEVTYQLIKDNNFRFIKREPVSVKGKGMMKMYFIEK